MYKNILVPVAYDEDHDPARALALARTMAAPEARITLLHVMDEVPAYALSYLPGDFRKDAREAVEADMAAQIAGIEGAAGAVIEGHAGRAIVDFAAETGVDLIVIASHRPGLSDLFLGSTAARVVRHATCSVHVMRGEED